MAHVLKGVHANESQRQKQKKEAAAEELMKGRF